MADRMYNVAQMLREARDLKLKAPYGSEERHYFERECYKWENELMANSINPTDIDTFEFKVQHKAFDSTPALQLQAEQLYLSTFKSD